MVSGCPREQEQLSDHSISACPLPLQIPSPYSKGVSQGFIRTRGCAYYAVMIMRTQIPTVLWNAKQIADLVKEFPFEVPCSERELLTHPGADQADAAHFPSCVSVGVCE